MPYGLFPPEKLKSIKVKPTNLTCIACGLHSGALTPRMKPWGKFKNRVMVIGEGPGKTEDEEGRPWQGKAGIRLQTELRSLGIDLAQDCLSLNAVNCRPPDNRAPTPHEMACCQAVIIGPTLENYRPRTMLLLGGSAIQTMIGQSWKKDLGAVGRWRGWTIPDQRLHAWVCPTFHPSYIEREKKRDEVLTIWRQDLKRALDSMYNRVPDNSNFQDQITLLHDEVDILAALNRIIKREEGDFCAFDYETTGLKPHAKGHEIVCTSISTAAGTYAFLGPRSEAVKSTWKAFLRSDINKAAHNIKFEDAWSRVILECPVNNWSWDSMLAAHVLDNRAKVSSLKFQVYVTFGIAGYDDAIAPYLEGIDSKNSNSLNKIHDAIKRLGANEVLTYCAFDSLFCRELSLRQIKEIHKTGNMRDGYNLLHRGVLALSRAEQHGFRQDLQASTSQIDKLNKRIVLAEERFAESALSQAWYQRYGAKINLASPTQLGAVLYDDMGLTPLKKTASGKGSTDEEALKGLNVKELEYLLRSRKFKKLRDTYLKAHLREQVDGVIHPFFHLHTVETYRSSSSNPNWQNVPKRDKEAMLLIRSGVFAREGHIIVEIDFSGIEVCIATTYHKDPEMLKYLNDPKSDMHADQAYILFKLNALDDRPSINFRLPEFYTLRQAGKNGFVFPQFYGDYYGNCAINLACTWGKLPGGKWKRNQGIPLPDGLTLGEHLINEGIKSLDDFTQHVKEAEDIFWNQRFRVYNKWRKQWFEDYQGTGSFDMHTGFRCQGVMRRNEVINYPVQGTAFHCLLQTLIDTDEVMQREGWRSRIIGEVHDSMILDVHPDELDHVVKTVNRIACEELPKRWPWINVPMAIEVEASEVDGSWATVKPYEVPK